MNISNGNIALLGLPPIQDTRRLNLAGTDSVMTAIKILENRPDLEAEWLKSSRWGNLRAGILSAVKSISLECISIPEESDKLKGGEREGKDHCMCSDSGYKGE